MKTLTTATFISVMVLSLLQAQAPKVMPLAIDYAPAPASWEDLAKIADAVAVVHLKSRITQDKPRASGSRDIVSRFSAEVVEVLKDNQRFPLAGVIDIYRAGGTIDTPDGRVTYAERLFPQWVPGMTLVVFLEWRDNDQGYRLVIVGPDAAYELDADTNKVRTHGVGPLAKAQKDRGSTEFVAELRKRIKK
jgi:hypothetical protein